MRWAAVATASQKVGANWPARFASVNLSNDAAQPPGPPLGNQLVSDAMHGEEVAWFLAVVAKLAA